MYFTDEEKIRLFNKIDHLYFHRNFGSTSKSDLETMLFSEYVNCCRDHGIPYDDYSLSKKLGITQRKISNLKERMELKYPAGDDNDHWLDEFAKAVRSAKYDEKDHYIEGIFEDVNVRKELQHFAESAGLYDKVSLTGKKVKIPLDCFAELYLQNVRVDEVFSSDALKTVDRVCKEDPEGYALRMLTDDWSIEGFKRFLMTASKDAIDLALSLLPFDGAASAGFSSVRNIRSFL